jgi:hypothetical protein
MRTVQSRLQSIYAKMGISEVPSSKGGAVFNRRNRAVVLALMARQINSKTLEALNNELAFDD